MIRLEEVLQLKEGEEVKAVTRRHVVTLLPELIAATVLIVAPFFFLFPLFTSGPAGIVLFGVLVIVGVILAVRGFIIWDGDLLIVTNNRLVDVDQQGMFARVINEISYINMQDPSWSKTSPIDFLLGVGRVSARSSSGSLIIEARYIPRPKELHELITDYSQQALVAAGWAAPANSEAPSRPSTESKNPKDTLVDRVSKQIASMDEEALKKLSETLKGNQQDIAIAKLFGNDKNRLKEIDES